MSSNKSKNAVIDTVKRQVNYNDLPREELLDIIVYLQSELEAREVLIAALKNEKSKNLYLQARYGQLPGRGGDPFQALQRDSEAMQGNKPKSQSPNAFDDPNGGTAALRPIYDSQLSQLENLIATQKRAQTKIRDQLIATEKKYQKAVIELSEERKRHERDSAQGDDVLVHLEKERERLKAEVEYEKAQCRKLEKELLKVQQELLDEKQTSNLQRQAATRLLCDYYTMLHALNASKVESSTQECASQHDPGSAAVMLSSPINPTQRAKSPLSELSNRSRSASPNLSFVKNGTDKSHVGEVRVSTADSKHNEPRQLPEMHKETKISGTSVKMEPVSQSLNTVKSEFIVSPALPTSAKALRHETPSSSTSASSTHSSSSSSVVESPAIQKLNSLFEHLTAAAAVNDSTLPNGGINNNVADSDSSLAGTNVVSRRLKPEPPIRRTPEQSYTSKAMVSGSLLSMNVNSSTLSAAATSTTTTVSSISVPQQQQQQQLHRILPQPNLLVSSYIIQQGITPTGGRMSEPPSSSSLLGSSKQHQHPQQQQQSPSFMQAPQPTAVYATPRKLLPQQPPPPMVTMNNNASRMAPPGSAVNNTASSRVLPLTNNILPSSTNSTNNASSLHHIAPFQASAIGHTMIPQHLSQIKFMPGSAGSNDHNSHNSLAGNHPYAPANYISSKPAGLTTPTPSASQHSHW